ncbi:beta-lactamase family protein [Flagellimonas sp. 389]|uniref:serine hydrolase domain-containing protein n=1 Tax=Flagellimonas sp. 389 TaxID=2835862 RepID=UPI001BD2A2A8|nr:serine hydrolase domain-containing protein [Flagellimonas sp. 389]MBS9461143.1 beta-lactamase family protein [Flagellimonas sp. 389]
MKNPILVILSIFLLIQHNKAQQLSGDSIMSEKSFDSVSVTIKVDSIMTNGIQNHAFPGAQVLVAKNNEVIFHKAYGYHTYDSIQKVSLTDVYDLASVTKITAPLPAIMKLVDEKKLDLDLPFSTYWKPWRNRKTKKNITLREILSHQAGLTPYIVFLSKVIKNGKLKKKFVKNSTSKKFQKQAYTNIFVKDRFQRKIYRIINRSKVSDDKIYKYSGLTFLIFPELIAKLTQTDYETYLQEQFYKPLGAHTLGFNPSKKGFPNTIVPTENDTLFRKDLVKGWVHDENASLLGGVSGNAGLFGTADDLVKMMLFYQNYGLHNGKQMISKETMKEFARIQFPQNQNRRGLGFDKPLIGNDTLSLKDAYPSPLASQSSFGHSGFTGTFVWTDPENQLVFIFLSNRVYPTRSHRNLYELNIRTELQHIFYKAFLANTNHN